MLEALDLLASEARSDLDAVEDAEALEAWRIRYLGTKGSLKTTAGMLADIAGEDRPTAGRRLNEVKQVLVEAFEAKRAAVAADDAPTPLDLTEPGVPCGQGRRHVLTSTIDDVVEVFVRMGFSVAHGPEVEDEWHNFTALNIPEDHPARDPRDNFYLAGDRLLRSQTSTVQIRIMERMPPPLRVISVGRVYRPDTHDATHYSMFHQVEGLCLDEGITMVDLKTVLYRFAGAFFGADVELRMRPSFFPFTEPSAEVDMRMDVKGEARWVELGGCGMVDPAVLEAVGHDPERWTGYAFGLGIERIAMRRHAIPDIRLLFENDARFLRQF